MDLSSSATVSNPAPAKPAQNKPQPQTADFDFFSDHSSAQTNSFSQPHAPSGHGTGYSNPMNFNSGGGMYASPNPQPQASGYRPGFGVGQSMPGAQGYSGNMMGHPGANGMGGTNPMMGHNMGMMGGYGATGGYPGGNMMYGGQNPGGFGGGINQNFGGGMQGMPSGYGGMQRPQNHGMSQGMPQGYGGMQSQGTGYGKSNLVSMKVESDEFGNFTSVRNSFGFVICESQNRPKTTKKKNKFGLG